MKTYILGACVGVFPIVIYYLYVYGMLRIGNVLHMIKEMTRKEWIALFVICLFSVSVTSILLQQNNNIYYWDYCMHWTPAVSMSKLLFTNPMNIVKNVIYTIGHLDYNWAMPLLYALPCRIFGWEYSDTIIIAQVFYMFPVYVVISLYFNKILNMLGIGKKSVPLYTFFITLIPIIQNVFLKGFLDAPVLMISTLILIIVSDFDYSRVDIVKCVMIALGIITLLIFRRHWSYWCVGLVCYMIVACLFQIRNNPKQVLKNAMISALIIGVICLFFLLVPFRDFLFRSLRNYEGIYTAWNGTFSVKKAKLIGAFGIFIEAFLICIPIIIGKLKKKSSILLPLCILIVLPTYLISRSVTMHDSHFYLIVVPILLIIIIGLNCVGELINSKRYRYIYGVFSVGFILLNYLNYAFWDFFSSFDGKIYNHLFRQTAHYEVLYRPDVNTLKTMVQDINMYVDEYDTPVYICAGSGNLNESLLLNVNQPESFLAISRFLNASAVDLRDGFKTSFFDAGIIVVEEPTPDLESNHYQKSIYGVIWYLSEQLRDDTSPLGRHYRLLKQYTLQNGTIGDIYLKESPIEKEDYESLMHFYDELYPENKDIFSERIRQYMDENNINGGIK